MKTLLQGKHLSISWEEFPNLGELTPQAQKAAYRSLLSEGRFIDPATNQLIDFSQDINALSRSQDMFERFLTLTNTKKFYSTTQSPFDRDISTQCPIPTDPTASLLNSNTSKGRLDNSSVFDDIYQ